MWFQLLLELQCCSASSLCGRFSYLFFCPFLPLPPPNDLLSSSLRSWPFIRHWADNADLHYQFITNPSMCLSVHLSISFSLHPSCPSGDLSCSLLFCPESTPQICLNSGLHPAAQDSVRASFLGGVLCAQHACMRSWPGPTKQSASCTV